MMKRVRPLWCMVACFLMYPLFLFLRRLGSLRSIEASGGRERKFPGLTHFLVIVFIAFCVSIESCVFVR